MLDFNNLPTWTKVNKQVFTGTTLDIGTAAPYSSVYTWTKPRGATFVYFFVIGGGGGGGAGQRGAVNAAGGGAGGGSGNIASALFLASMIPDTLYIQVALGGRGGVEGTSATAGASSQVSIVPEFRSPGNLLIAANGGGAGGAGNSSGFSTAGAGAGTTSSGNIGEAFGLLQSMIAGQAGTAGGNPGVAGIDGTFTNTGPVVTGGRGGGGFVTAINSAGANGGITTAIGTTPGVFPTITRAIGGTLAGTPGASGSNGMRARSDLTYFVGGSGGAGAGCAAVGNTGLAGGAGGNGGYGCGGGGGGGGFTGSSGGQGGNGGPGLVIVASW